MVRRPAAASAAEVAPPAFRAVITSYQRNNSTELPMYKVMHKNFQRRKVVQVAIGSYVLNAINLGLNLL